MVLVSDIENVLIFMYYSNIENFVDWNEKREDSQIKY